MNPYNQWLEAGTTPSIYGALPVPSLPPQVQTVTYKFIELKNTVLNSTVVGPDRRRAYIVTTETSGPARTVFVDGAGRNVAMAEWQPTVMVEVQGVCPRKTAREWLRLSSDRSCRIMDIRGVQYAWETKDGFIYLRKVRTEAPRVLARIAKVPNEIILELSGDAMQLGLLEPALVATALLTCGQGFD